MGNSNQSCAGYDAFRVSSSFAGSICLIANVYILYQFVCRWLSKEQIYSNKPKKVLFNIGAVFIIFVIIQQIIMIVLSLHGCVRKENISTYRKALSTLFMFFYFFQSYLLSLIVFITLRYSFNDTPFALTKCTVKTYKILFATIPILGIINFIASKTAFGTGFTPLMILFLLGFFISLISLFIRKLVVIYKNIDASADFVTRITKLTALNTISILMTLFVPLFVGLVSLTHPVKSVASAGLIFGILADTTTNVWCIVMTYQYFSNYYLVICKCMHGCCGRLWAKCLGQEARILVMINDDTDQNTGPTMELSIDAPSKETTATTATTASTESTAPTATPTTNVSVNK